ncbi:GNAT family N-acetyltransferase [Jiangella ureilytica]|uniref:GNAT family N-acetyltransferase n=1 Tax=Jiangella ureilytica TaxID=2530374 RepID=A0A4R4RV27_9ACTN|nr:GNAT family N-acetyltransferase [Jiangella ureilytica]TDC53981.1 GNAT family N-acetyltransferase [Jiangella ureilytica]
MAGVTLVTVDPTATRQGLLRTMLAALHDRAIANGQPVAGLVPSEWAIYGRFGYGPATWADTMSIDASRVSWLADTPTSNERPRPIDGAEAVALAARLHRDVALRTPGDIVRSDAYWDRLATNTGLVSAALGLTDHPEVALRHIAVADRGFASYQLNVAWTPQHTANSQITVIDFLASDSGTAAALWRHLLSLDLVVTAHVQRVADDDPLAWWLRDPRLLSRRRHDGLWLRPLDPPTLLESRRWSGTGSLVLQVHDAHGYADGTYHLHVDDGIASCTPTNAEPDLIMDVAALGAGFLGGTSMRELSVSGWVSTPEPRAALLWDQLAASAAAPYLSTSF